MVVLPLPAHPAPRRPPAPPAPSAPPAPPAPPIPLPPLTASQRNYMRQLSIENGNRHFLPWGAIVLTNCDQEGNLLNFDTLNTYKHQQLPLWIVLTLYLFKDAQNMIYPIFKCEHCETMNLIYSLKTHQEKARMQLSKCIHSVISGKLVEDDGGWRDRWEVVCDRDIAQSNKF